uniref:Gamma carbonic anhydrase n=1 Tax=Dunaliella tertiolecta TaxID=3047 RepID=A0A7S3QRY5_DUNTE|mmetsp:Transcript_9425/g.25436  ORF Transcript_9425/g.25436 Transcript_9425/m.25436 type:complete len:230 (+) Transcript_9425:65-754(+)
MLALNLAKSVAWRVGFAIRESGQALERVGCRLQGIYSHEEQLCRHMPSLPVQYDAPSSAPGSFAAPSSLMVGNVSLGRSSSLWYNAIVRGDLKGVSIGNNTNIQDSAYVGASSEYSPPVEIGNNVSIGHGAVIKGATIGDNVLIGINAVVSEGCQIEPNSIIAAGAYLEENTLVPSGEVWAGNPAKKLRDIKPEERTHLKDLPAKYADMAGQHEEIIKLLKMKQQEYTL